MDNNNIMSIAKNQSALDYSIDVLHFSNGTYSIKSPKEVSNHARNYLKAKPYLNLVYYGDALVVIADDEISEFMTKFCEKNKHEIYRLFDAPQITLLNNELEKRGKCIAHLAEYFLPDINFKPNLNNQIETKMFVGDELKKLYSDNRFTMALAYTRDHNRRDEIAIAGYINDEIVGVAGASNDSNTMWQIGIDVLEGFRNQKIATTLTYLLSQEILKRGIVPFYGCAWSNIASKNTARKAGFRNAWVELTAKDIDESWIKKTRSVDIRGAE